MSDNLNYNGTVFSLGDKVRVTRAEGDLAPDGMGAGKAWLNRWVGHMMDDAVGRVFTVSELDEEAGVGFSEYGSFTMLFPLSVLEHVEVEVAA